MVVRRQLRQAFRQASFSNCPILVYLLTFAFCRSLEARVSSDRLFEIGWTATSALCFSLGIELEPDPQTRRQTSFRR